jgi:hypothetical protein
MSLPASNPSKRRYCYPQCRDPWFNECADCWKSGGNPAIGVKVDEPKPPSASNPSNRLEGLLTVRHYGSETDLTLHPAGRSLSDFLEQFEGQSIRVTVEVIAEVEGGE